MKGIEVEHAHVVRDTRVCVATLVCACFLLGSTGWLSWLRQIAGLADPMKVDLYTMVLGYLSQAVGIGLFMAVAKWRGMAVQRAVVVASLLAYAVLVDPATTSSSLATTLVCGWLMNICCGVSQGFYLASLAACVEQERRGVVFGGGYAASTLLTWVLSSIGGGVLTAGVPCLVVCAVLAALSVGLALAVSATVRQAGDDAGCEADGDAVAAGQVALAIDAPPAQTQMPEGAGFASASGNGQDGRDGPALRDGVPPKAGTEQPVGSGTRPSAGASLLALAGATVVLVSLVKNAGFAFPTSDLSGVVNLELSRLFYGVGLVMAGVAADRDRRFALALCAVSLVVPFLMLALTGAGATGVVLWVVGYLLFGFFTVFRITLFADLAADGGRPWVAGAGLALGRVGDALGTALCLALADSPIALILVTSVLFTVAAALLFKLFNRQFGAEPVNVTERDPIGEFCMAYGLSAREREVLPYVVQGKTNAEIAAALFVTESTVKYHLRNIREKTGCATRLDVANLYIESLRS